MTQRTEAELLALYPDNNQRLITPERLRDFVVSAGLVTTINTWTQDQTFSGNVAVGGNLDVDGNISSFRSNSGLNEILLNLVNQGSDPGSAASIWLSGNNSTTRGVLITAESQGSASGTIHDLVLSASGAGALPTERMRIKGSNGAVSIASTTDVTSPTDTNASGSFAGGLAVAKRLFVGGTIEGSSDLVLASDIRSAESSSSNRVHTVRDASNTNVYNRFLINGNNVGVFASGNRLRVRLGRGFATSLLTHHLLEVRFGGANSTAADRNGAVFKQFAFGISTSTMSNKVSNVSLIDQFVDAEIDIAHVGSSSQIDLVIQHPAAHTSTFGTRWFLDIVVYEHGESSTGFVVIEAVIEAIP